MGNDEKQSSDGGSRLAGPAVVTINVVSPRGPIARKDTSLSIPQTRFCIVNTSNALVESVGLTLDPLQQSKTGTRVESKLVAQAAPGDLGPGGSVDVVISGFIPAEPGIYTSTLRVAPPEGPPLAMRIEFRVASRAAWGFACMVFGLSLVALINILDSEGGNKGELRDALLARQSARELLQQAPPPQSLAARVAIIDREFDVAIASLQRPREYSFVDHRSADAREHLKAAVELTAELRKTLSEKPQGGIEVADLSREWAQLTESFSLLSKQFLVPPPQGAALAQRLGAFDAWAAQRLLQPDIAFFSGELSRDIARVHLLNASGRERDAAEAATTVRRRMQRAADAVSAQAQLLRRFIQQSANEISTESRIRQSIGSAVIIPAMSADVLKPLEDAAALLAEPFNWTARRAVAQRIGQARSAFLNAVVLSTTQSAQSARARAEEEYSMAAVQAVVDEGATLKRGVDGKISDPKEKTAWLKRVVAVWRARLFTLPDPDPPALVAKLDAVEAAVESNDLDAVSTRLSELFRQMAAYSSERAKSAILKATARSCIHLRDELMIDLVAAQQTMGHLDGNSAVLKWEGELDGLRRKANATPDLVEMMPPDCLGTMIGLAATVGQLRNEIDSAAWAASVLPDATKQALATDLAKSLTPQVLATFLSEVRPLHIDVATAPDERYVGRQIEFKIANIAADWRLDVNVVIEFGDGQSAVMTAEELRKNPSVIHVFAEPKRFGIVAKAMEKSGTGGTHAGQKILGVSQNQTLSILRSPISAAREVSEAFLNARFGLALLVAMLLYYWRFHARKVVFGAAAFDYVEAFALGFAVSLAVNELPEKLAKLYPLGG